MQLCVHLYPIKENYVLETDVEGATDGESIVTKEGTEGSQYFNMAGATHGEDVTAK